MKILLIGTGSIANRHLNNIFKLKPDTIFYVYSRSRRTLLNTTQVNRDDLVNHTFDLVIIASESDKHDLDLELVLALKVNKIFLEKPASLNLETARRLRQSINRDKIDVRVGYDLRYHDGIRYLKDKFQNEIKLQENIIIYSQVGQNLQTWRDTDNGFKSYSFDQSKSGGIIYDLSHELDFVNYIINECLYYSVKSIKSEFFNTDLEDIAIVNGISKTKNIIANFELNCISHSFYRLINIHTKNKTYSLDLITGEYKELTFGEIKFKKKFCTDRDSRYRNLWKDLFEGSTILPGYNESIIILERLQ